MKWLNTLILLGISIFVKAQDHKTLYEVLDATEANRLYQALKSSTTNTPLWPIATSAVERKFLPSTDYLGLQETERIEIDANNTLIKTRVARISLYSQGLAGIIPAVQLDSLRELGLSNNAIEGISPELNLPKLTNLGLGGNQLKNYPRSGFPALTSLELSNNGLEGLLPNDIHILTPKLEILLCDGNKLTGNPEINHPVLKTLELDRNQLTGNLNKIIISGAIYLDVSENRFEGVLSINSMPKLTSLDIERNSFSDFGPGFHANTPDLENLFAAYNAFEFDDLLPLVGYNYEGFSYNNQAAIQLKNTPVDGKQKLTAEVAGAGNVYHWVYVHPSSKLRARTEDSIPYFLSLYLALDFNDTSFFRPLGGNENFLEIAGNENPIFYGCRVTNPALSKLRIAAVYPVALAAKCWENTYFSICLDDEGASWSEGEEDHQIASSGSVIINDFIQFEGSLTLDTVNLTLSSKGKYFLKDIPIPGNGIGNFTLAEGEYELGLAGEEGKINGFINDKLGTYTPDIGGLKIKLDDLALVGGRKATGVSLSFTVEWDNITPSCGSSKDQSTSIRISGLTITSEGISVDGMEVGDLGLAPGFCLKELKASYDGDEDKLAFALAILTPFIEVGGGLEFIAGELETVEMKAELQNSIIPIATTGIGIIGCEGRVSRITNPPFNIKFGGIFSAVASNNLFRLTTSVEFIPPSELKLAAGDGKFFNPPLFDDDWWLAEGGIYGSLDLVSYRLKMGGNIKVGPYRNEDDEKAFMTEGSVDLGLRKEPVGMVFTGQVKGSVTIPELGEDWPYDWLNAKLGLPYSVNGDAMLVYKPTAKYINGDINLGGRIGEVHYDINLNKRYDQEGFISFIVHEADLTTAPRSRNRIIQIPEQTRIAVVKATGIHALPALELTSPGGQVINENNLGTATELDKLAAKQKVFFTLYQPEPGSWTLSTANEDSLEVYFIPYDFELNFKAEGQNQGIILSWNHQDFKSTDSLEFYLDDDTTGFNGVYLGTISANQSQFVFDYLKAEGLCSFYIYALANKGGLVKARYAPNRFSNQANGFPAPSGLSMTYTPGTGVLAANWTPATHPDLSGYVIGLENDTTHRVLAMLYPDEISFTDTLLHLNDPVVYIQAYGRNGQVSCPVSTQKTVATPETVQLKPVSPLVIYPNPNNGRITIEYQTGQRMASSLFIYDLLGRLVKMIGKNDPALKEKRFEIALNELTAGTYIITGIIGKNWYSNKIVVVE